VRNARSQPPGRRKALAVAQLAFELKALSRLPLDGFPLFGQAVRHAIEFAGQPYEIL